MSRQAEQQNLRITQTRDGTHEIWINGVQVTMVQSIDLYIGPDNVATATIRVVGYGGIRHGEAEGETMFDGVARVTVVDRTQEMTEGDA